MTSSPSPSSSQKSGVNDARENSPLFMALLNASIIGLVAITWSLSTQFSKSALTFDTKHFNAPYFMMWLNTNFMLTCFPVFLLYEKIRTGKSVALIYRESQSKLGKRQKLTPATLVKYVLPFLIFWIGANYPYVRALLLITPSVATSISACNAAFVYILSVIILAERIHIMKIFSVLLSIGGVVVISMDNEMKIEWLGVLLAFVSAFIAAVYKVLFKKLIGNATLGDVSLFMSSLGFLNLILNWIVPLILVVTNVEILNVAYIPWAPVVGAALLSIAFNFTINFGIALLNPLVISVGMLCGIPLNTVIDIVFRHLEVSALFIVGTAMIILSFLLIILPYEKIDWFSRRPNSESSKL